ncbi:hypothetical protein [Phenylobacterium sp.]|uniref:hypothetical protein n=1 Tax=Phenylobacterium sp. TaxID=1871053 RepID=UPI00301D9600
MPLPIALPLTRRGPAARSEGGVPDRIADLVLRLEDDAAPALAVTTWVVRGRGGVTPWVVCILSDGAREAFSPSDARVLAVALRDALGVQGQLHAWADSLDDAAEAAERQASAVLLGAGAGGWA